MFTPRCSRAADSVSCSSGSVPGRNRTSLRWAHPRTEIQPRKKDVYSGWKVIFDCSHRRDKNIVCWPLRFMDCDFSVDCLLAMSWTKPLKGLSFKHTWLPDFRCKDFNSEKTSWFSYPSPPPPPVGQCSIQHQKQMVHKSQERLPMTGRRKNWGFVQAVHVTMQDVAV